MPVVTKNKLLITYDIYKAHNGFTLPSINEEDIKNGIDTPEKKFEAWAYKTQIHLNAVLQDGLAAEDYTLEAFEPYVQHDIINIMVTRLVRAFYNDEILARDFGLNYSQQGGVNYSSAGDIDPKTALYSFFNGDERLLIENSGLITSVFSGAEDDGIQTGVDNKFKDGPLVPEVNWNDKANNIIVINGQNRSVQEALTELQNGKVSVTDLAKAISDATGLSTDPNVSKILVELNKYIEYQSYRSNKGENEVAQVKDVKDSETRSREDIVNAQKGIKANTDNISDLNTRVEDLEDEEELVDKIWKGSIDGVVSNDTKEFVITNIQDQDGKAFIFEAGKHLLVSLLFEGTRYSTDVEVGALSPDHLSIVKGGNTSTFDLSINTLTNPGDDVKLKLVKKTGTISIDDLSLVKILERKAGSTPDITKAQAKAMFISKSLKQNTDFTTYADLKLLVKDDDLVNIALASGENVSGVITDNGTPLVITGYITDGVTTKFGNVSIANDLTTTVTEKLQKNLEMDLNDAPFGKVISTDAILTSNKIDGSRKVPSIEYELVDKKYVDDEIKAHSGGGGNWRVLDKDAGEIFNFNDPSLNKVRITIGVQITTFNIIETYDDNNDSVMMGITGNFKKSDGTVDKFPQVVFFFKEGNGTGLMWILNTETGAVINKIAPDKVEVK